MIYLDYYESKKIIAPFKDKIYSVARRLLVIAKGSQGFGLRSFSEITGQKIIKLWGLITPLNDIEQYKFQKKYWK